MHGTIIMEKIEEKTKARCPWCGEWLVQSKFGFLRCTKCNHLVTRQDMAEKIDVEKREWKAKERVAKRVDPSHVHEYRLASILQNYEGPNKDGFHMRGFCWKCWAQLDIDLECSGGSIDSEIHEITERAWGKGKGLYAFQVSEQTLYLRKLVQLFPGDK